MSTMMTLALLGAMAGDLDGTWRIEAMLDDGELISSEAIRDQFVANEQIVIRGQNVELLPPGGRSPRALAFVTDPTQSPATFDLAGSNKVGSRGIYQRTDDTLVICLGDPDIDARPVGFSSPAGSKQILITMKLTGPPTPRRTTPAANTAPARPSAERDEEIRRALVGTWGHQTPDANVTMTFNSDNSFSTAHGWKRGFRRVFDEGGRASGTWKVENGVVLMSINAATDPDLVMQVFSYRVRTLSDKELIAVDQDGRLRREWKVE